MDDDLTEYQALQRWNKGVKPAARGRLWRRTNGADSATPQAKTLPARLRGARFLPPQGTMGKGAEQVTYTIHQVVPCDNWQAEYLEDDGTTYYADVHLLASATLTDREGATSAVILGVEYDAADGWALVVHYDNFLALVPPESD